MKSLFFRHTTPRSNILADVVQQFKLQSTANKPPNTAELKGFFKHNGVFPLQKNTRLSDLIKISGGLQIGTDRNYALLFRQNNLMVLTPSSHQAE